MNTFSRFKKTTNDMFGGGATEPDAVSSENLGNDNEFDFDVPEDAQAKISIDSSTEADENPYEIQKINLTRIGEDTVITGDIKTKGHIDVLGTVKGDITAEGNIALRCDIEGNVRGNNIGLGGCVLNGNVEAVKNILAGDDSEINGNVRGSEISIAGKVSGDVSASKIIVLRKEAVMQGNIDTDELVVEPGAIINGKISINRQPAKVEEKRESKIEEPKNVYTPESAAEPDADAKEQEEVKDVKEEDIIDI